MEIVYSLHLSYLHKKAIMYRIYFIFLLSFILFANILAQNLYDIKNPGSSYSQKCSSCVQAIEGLPKEVQFGILRDGADDLYFYLTDINYFDALFEKSGDGLAVDIVSKDVFECEKPPVNERKGYRGKVLEPVYRNDLKKSIQPSPYGAVVKVGHVPSALREKSLEYNIIFLSNKYYCFYYTVLSLSASKWDLLDMGLYMDTLVMSGNDMQQRTQRNISLMNRKVLEFEIPFEKNKTVYNREDIQPFYDSLKMNKYFIKNIQLKAYSSVEGSTENNIALQQGRARSIIDVLQSFQLPEIVFNIEASENWVEFFADIQGTEYAYLLTMRKQDIKTELTKSKVAKDLEPFLKNHRKVMISLELEERINYNNLDENALKAAFDKSIEEKNIEKALKIQKTIFSKVYQAELPESFINRFEIPKEAVYSPLLVSQLSFKYFSNLQDALATYKAFNALDQIVPNNPHIKYNLCVLKFRLWLLGDFMVEPDEFMEEIKALKRMNIHPALVDRMMLNYHIILTDKYMYEGNYAEKDRSLSFIYRHYQGANLNDEAVLNLARYFSSFARYDWAEKVLKPQAYNINASDETIFYYLNLTIGNPKNFKSTDYRRVVENAINADQERFCKMFDSKEDGGISFQLLKNEYLKDSYCENCK